MNFNYQQYIPEDFDERSKVWIYQSSRLFTIAESLRIETMLNDFVSNWHSHGAKVKGYANLLFGRFIILMADESQTTVGGCSTDSAFDAIKDIQRELGVNLFHRQTLAFVVKEQIQLLPLSQFVYAYHNNFITADTLYFNNTVENKSELLTKWMIPVKDSWLRNKISKQPVV